MSTVENTTARPARRSEGRAPDFVVRAKTGPGRREWSSVGSAWKRDGGEGFTVKLNAIPIGPHSRLFFCFRSGGANGWKQIARDRREPQRTPAAISVDVLRVRALAVRLGVMSAVPLP